MLKDKPKTSYYINYSPQITELKSIDLLSRESNNNKFIEFSSPLTWDSYKKAIDISKNIEKK
ncbi:hypothetical protein K2V62_06145 [Mammaliicoccus sciuri]|uniref:hypothetical protein n=1 Tax=Mammaliicoccus sciuri TaxID=1296 RepID=UPI001E55D06F|nr:hypothetical protein [Mammaliicoccus sciuri]MCD8894276.1 hypothetical protein [Mammaliicoccus sciuri]MCD8912465.1 hypothetical protein [Mammaliicoccus sciuri]